MTTDALTYSPLAFKLFPRDYHYHVFAEPCPTCGSPPWHYCKLDYLLEHALVMAAHPTRHEAGRPGWEASR